MRRKKEMVEYVIVNNYKPAPANQKPIRVKVRNYKPAKQKMIQLNVKQGPVTPKKKTILVEYKIV